MYSSANVKGSAGRRTVGFTGRAFDLSEQSALDLPIKDVAVVVFCAAGQFSSN